MIAVLHQALQASVNPPLVDNICGVDSTRSASGVDVVVAVMRNKTVKRTLEVVGSLRKMFVERVCMGRRYPREDRGNVSSMRNVINQGLIL